MNVVSPEMHRKPSAALSRCWASFAYCLQHKLNSSYETHSIVCMGACLGTKIHCSVNTRFIEFIFQMQVTFSLSCQLVCSVQSASLWHTFTHWIYFQCNYFIVVMQIMSSSCQRSFRSSSLSSCIVSSVSGSSSKRNKHSTIWVCHLNWFSELHKLEINCTRMMTRFPFGLRSLKK